jgi:hypothetical protein
MGFLTREQGPLTVSTVFFSKQPEDHIGINSPKKEMAHSRKYIDNLP